MSTPLNQTSCRTPGVAGPRVRSCAPWLLFVFLVGSFQGQAQTTNDPLELLRGLDRLTINPAEIYVIRGAQITRDRVNFYFDRGLIGFLTPINGEVTGAVFAGDGEVLLMPADAAERRSLAQFTNSPILEEQFTSAYLRFTDQTARELLTLVRRPEPEDFEFPESFAPQWNPLVERLNPSYSPRILVDLLGEREMPCFETWLQGKSLGAFQVLIDERFPEAVRVGKVGQSDGREYADVWCSLASKRSEARLADLLIGPAQVLAYKIETRIGADNNLEGRAELLLESRSAADRVLVFELARLLKVSEVREEAGSLLPLLQNPSLTESEAATPGDGWVFVILPAPHPVGTRFRLTFVYQGNVITDEGNGVLYVGQRGSWYPRRGFNSNATYDLTFQYPERLTLVATGECLEEKTSGGMKHSHWVSAQPVPVAGFNLGPYQSRGRKAGGVEIEVFAAREVEAALEKPHFELQPSNEISNNRPRGQTPLIAVAPAPAPPLDPAARLDGVTEVGATALEFFQSLWGRFPYPRLSVSQIPGDFGQGWPGLVYLPTLAFLPDSARARLGLNKPEDVYNEIALAHEIAHQWWGNQVGWQSYHDQWLSEGFATYAAALYLASEKDGKRKFEALLQDYKATLLSKNPQGATIESGGPVWLGHRLSNSLNPNGYANIIYKKACWVIHMLRCLMSDGKTGSKERFFTMLRDFLETYRGQFPSTKDFVRHAEKYMSPVMDIEHDGRLDWFFNDWVFGTGIPTYELDTSTRRISAKKFVVEGTIKQSGVPSDFEMPVPLIASYGKERSARLGWVVVSADGASFRFTTAEKPSRAAIDENSILAVVK